MKRNANASEVKAAYINLSKTVSSHFFREIILKPKRVEPNCLECRDALLAASLLDMMMMMMMMVLLLVLDGYVQTWG